MRAPPDGFPEAGGCSRRGPESPFDPDGFERWNTDRMPLPEDDLELVEWTTAPVAARVFCVEIGWPHFGHFGNDPMQCWQSGAPHE